MKDACDEVHASGGVADVDSSILLDTDVDFGDVINPSVFCNDDNSSVSCDANVDSSVFSDADIVDISVSCDGTWHRRGFSSLNGTVLRLVFCRRGKKSFLRGFEVKIPNRSP